MKNLVHCFASQLYQKANVIFNMLKNIYA